MFGGLGSEIKEVSRAISRLRSSLVGNPSLPTLNVVERVDENIEDINKRFSELKEDVPEESELSEEVEGIKRRLSILNSEFRKVLEFIRDLNEARDLYTSNEISQAKFKQLERAIRKKYRQYASRRKS